MSDDKTDKRMSTGIGLFSDIRVHEIHVSLLSYPVTIQHRAKIKIKKFSTPNYSLIDRPNSNVLRIDE